MSLKHIGLIVAGAGLDPTAHRTEIQADSCRVVLIGVNEPSQALEVAKSMVKDGAQRIELCGGFDAVWAAAVVVAIGGEVPVGSLGPWSNALLRASVGPALASADRHRV